MVFVSNMVNLCTIGTWTADIEEFDTYLYYKAKECKNWEDIKTKLI